MAAALAAGAEDHPGTGAPTVRPAPEAIKEVARKVLSDPHYLRVAREDWLVRLAQAVRDWLGRILRRIPHPSGAIWGWVVRALYYLLLTISLLVVGWALWRVVGALRARGLGWERAGAPSAAEPEAVAAPASSERAIAQALETYRAGDFRAAIRFLFVALLLRMDEHGVLRYDPRRTNREVLRTLAPEAEERKRLSSAIQVFEVKWYGLEEANLDEVQAFADLCGFDLAARLRLAGA